MKILNLFKIAGRSLAKNKMRTFLTMLGIIIGVASVISMLAIGQGSKENIQSSISSLGINSIIIIPGSVNTGGVRTEAGTAQSLKREDAEAIAQRCENIIYVSPVVQKGSQVIAGAENWRTPVMGVFPDYFNIRNLSIASGNLFSMTDDRAAAKVCVIGQTVCDNLFGENVDPVGKFVRINRIPFKVIGLLEKKGQNTFGQDQDDIILAPFATVQKRMLSTLNVNMIISSARSEEAMDDARNEVVNLIRERHKLPATEDDDFTVRTQADVSNIFGTVSRVMTILLATIGGISLLVGGIGIMNIMLVSVTERTREIGIRLAIGAKSRDVLIQFLIEAIFISFIGGLLGVALGGTASGLIAKLAGWPVTITSFSVLVSFLFSAGIGVFFGWYPARKAANLNPIEALRFE
jgi:putative ABC transport system permease protein